jgi:hypothetical protein
MSEQEKEAAVERKSVWQRLAESVDEESGLQLIWDKGGTTFSPTINFKFKRRGEAIISRHGRITPDFKSDLDQFDPIMLLRAALERIHTPENVAILREAAKKDQAAYLARKREEEERSLRKKERRDPNGVRHTGKTARKKAAQAASKPTTNS